MIPRYSLYGTASQWAGNIRVDAGGRWVRWRDITSYLEYCEQQGFQPPEQFELPLTDPSIDIMAGRADMTIINEDDDHELPLDDGEDLYDLMTRYPQKINND